mgnify:CR=1 FL=1
MSYYIRKESFELPNGVRADIFLDTSIMFTNALGQHVSVGFVSNLYPLLEYLGITVNEHVSLPNGLTWDDAPVWANYAAQDEDSTWYWYEGQPEAVPAEGRWDCYLGNIGQIEEPSRNWQDRVVKRPQDKSKPSCNGKVVEIDGKKYKLEEV